MTNFARSNRNMGLDHDQLPRIIRDVDLRLERLEQYYSGEYHVPAVVAVSTLADLPIEPPLDHYAFVIADSSIHQAVDTGGPVPEWQPASSLPTWP